ncbi:hypothetical protein ACTFTM_20720 [Micromonospora sp. RB23]
MRDGDQPRRGNDLESDREATPETVPGLAGEAFEERLVVESRHVEAPEVGVVSAQRSEASRERPP